MCDIFGFEIWFESTDAVLPFHKYLWSEISRQWNNGPLNFFWNSHRRASCFLNFVKWGIIKASILLILLKCIAVGYSSGNESLTGRLFSNYRTCYSIYFDISFIVFFTRLLSKSLWRNYPFSAQISKIHFKM